MARDDYHTLVYKVLSYLYECLKAGVEPNLAQAANLVQVNERYWASALTMMKGSGYLTGIEVKIYKSDKEPTLIPLSTFGITEAGVEYLSTNFLMAKAREYLGPVFVATLQGAIQYLQTCL
jgi:hypothetical protein